MNIIKSFDVKRKKKDLFQFCAFPFLLRCWSFWYLGERIDFSQVTLSQSHFYSTVSLLIIRPTECFHSVCDIVLTRNKGGTSAKILLLSAILYNRQPPTLGLAPTKPIQRLIIQYLSDNIFKPRQYIFARPKVRFRIDLQQNHEGYNIYHVEKTDRCRDLCSVGNNRYLQLFGQEYSTNTPDGKYGAA